MSQETSDLTVKKEGNLPAELNFIQDAGAGLENMDKDDLALPFLKLLQTGSDETKKKHANYVEGAEAGMFYNTVTKKLYSGEKGIEVIPCFYKLNSVENSGSFTWHGYKVSLLRKVDNAAIYQMAREFHNSLKASSAKAETREESNY